MMYIHNFLMSKCNDKEILIVFVSNLQKNTQISLEYLVCNCNLYSRNQNTNTTIKCSGVWAMIRNHIHLSMFTRTSCEYIG